MATTITVNGVEHSVEATPDTPLLWVLRDHLDLTGTKFGCGVSMCGACTVHLDGQATRACVTPLAALNGRKITTIEGAGEASNIAKALQEKWNELEVAQCGYCQSGQLMSAAALLSQNKNPSDQDIDAAMSGNICRCATYGRIRSAIKETAKELA